MFSNFFRWWQSWNFSIITPVYSLSHDPSERLF